MGCCRNISSILAHIVLYCSQNVQIAAGRKIQLAPVGRSSISAWQILFRLSKAEYLSYLFTLWHSKVERSMVTRSKRSSSILDYYLLPRLSARLDLTILRSGSPTPLFHVPSKNYHNITTPRDQSQQRFHSPEST